MTSAFPSCCFSSVDMVAVISASADSLQDKQAYFKASDTHRDFDRQLYFYMDLKVINNFII